MLHPINPFSIAGQPRQVNIINTYLQQGIARIRVTIRRGPRIEKLLTVCDGMIFADFEDRSPVRVKQFAPLSRQETPEQSADLLNGAAYATPQKPKKRVAVKPPQLKNELIVRREKAEATDDRRDAGANRRQIRRAKKNGKASKRLSTEVVDKGTCTDADKGIRNSAGAGIDVLEPACRSQVPAAHRKQRVTASCVVVPEHAALPWNEREADKDILIKIYEEISTLKKEVQSLKTQASSKQAYRTTRCLSGLGAG